MKKTLIWNGETGTRRLGDISPTCPFALSPALILLFFIFLSFLTAKGQTYFQQDVKYNIHVTLNDVTHELSAYESIEYTNNSPDALAFLYFHLWPNGYKDNNSAMSKQMIKAGRTFFHYADDDKKGSIDSLKFRVNDTLVKCELNDTMADICKLILNKPLKPGQTISITTPFHVDIPDSRISRMGHDGESYQISQWFPKPAVYDVNGWNAMPYLDQGEFYSEFGTFDVYITLPDNYVVGATGDLVDGEKEIAWLENKAIETSQIKAFDTKDQAFPPSSKQTKTLHYHQEKIHDFAWFADKRYHVLKGEVGLPYSKNKVTTWVMFTNANAHLWKDGIEYVNDAIYYYSKWIGEYPYKHATAVEGALSAGGGMEYPNITVISSGGDSLSLEMVIMHEVGHNWFYGILGSNERKNPWMDEGINSFYEYRYLQHKYPGSTLFLGKVAKFIHLPAHAERTERSLLYEVAAHLNNDQPIGLHSEEYSTTNYGGIVYEKTSVSMAFLKDYLGEKDFDKAMQEYFAKWKFKHPQPADLRNTMELSTGKNLGWFFEDMINTSKKVDYKICKVRPARLPLDNASQTLTVTIKNKGEAIVPFEISGYKNDSLISSGWSDGIIGKGKMIVNFPGCNNIRINSENNCPEYNLKNNYSRTSGLFRKRKPLKIQLLPGVDDPMRTQICATPVMGYNHYNGLMAGMAFYNNPIPQKKFSYFLMPLYGTSDKNLAGYARAGFTFLPRGEKLQLIWLGANLSQYSFANDSLIGTFKYTKISPEILIRLKNKNARSTMVTEIRFRNININKETLVYSMLSDSGHYKPAKEMMSYYVNQLSISFAEKRKINPYGISLVAEQGDKFVKASVDGSYRLSYNKRNKYLDIRAFFGGFIYQDVGNHYYNVDMRYRLNGTPGYNDYLFDHYYGGRNEGSGLWSKQFCDNDGGFKTITALGQSWNWLTAINIKTTIPGKVPIRLFADIGTYEGAGRITGTNAIAYEAGIELSIIYNIFEIYFPIIMSGDLKKNSELNDVTRWENIRFTFNLEKANPFKLLRDIR